MDVRKTEKKKKVMADHGEHVDCSVLIFLLQFLVFLFSCKSVYCFASVNKNTTCNEQHCLIFVYNDFGV